jgi:hypothetical protein
MDHGMVSGIVRCHGPIWHAVCSDESHALAGGQNIRNEFETVMNCQSLG